MDPAPRATGTGIGMLSYALAATGSPPSSKPLKKQQTATAPTTAPTTTQAANGPQPDAKATPVSAIGATHAKPTNISQSVPITTWDEYQYNLFTAPTASVHNNNNINSDSDDDLLGASRMVDWVVGQDSPILSEEEDLYPGNQNRLSTSSFSKGTFLFQSTSSSYKQQFQPPAPNTINKFDSDDLTFDITDLDLDTMSFSSSFNQKKGSLLPPSTALFNPPTTSALKKSGSNSSEQTPTSTFKSLRTSTTSTHSSVASSKPLPDLNLLESSLPPAHHQSFASRYGASPSSNNNSSFKFGTSPGAQQAYSYGTSPNTQQGGISIINNNNNNGQNTQSGTSPVLINSYIGSGNAMRPNGLFSTTPNASLLSSSFDNSQSGGGGFLSSSYQGQGQGQGGIVGGGNNNGGLRAAASHGRLDISSSFMSGTGMAKNALLGVGAIAGPGTTGMLLPPGRVVGGMVLNNAGVARSELAEDGCPILKVPRMPFLGVQGTMEIPHRVWKKGGTEKPDNRHFMIMSYNVLAPMYCTDSRYSHSKTDILDWDHRRKMILDEIAFYSPDFICLQELPPSDFKDILLPALQKIGYDGHFQQKKREHAADGCAIFFLEARFSLMAVQAFAYNDQIPQDPASDLYQRLSPFPNIALVCVFQNRQARSLRCRIVNTHLHWDPQFADTKLLQAAILMEWLERAPHRDVPTAIAADLNSRAGEAVVDYLVRGKVAPGPLFSGKDFGRFTKALTVRNPITGVTVLASTLAGQPGFEGLLHGGVVIQNPNAVAAAAAAAASSASSATGASAGAPAPVPQQQTLLPLLRHGTKLASAYDRKDLPFTNKTPDFEGSIDHILYTSGTLSIRDVLGDFDQTYYPASPPPPTATAMDVGGDSGSDSEEKASGGGSVNASGDDGIVPETIGGNDEQGDGAASVTPTTAAPTPGPRPYHHHQPPPPQGYLAKISSFPTPHIPSDHLPLCAWLKWKTVPVGTGPGVNSALNSQNQGGGGSNNNALRSSVGDRAGRSRGGRRGMNQQQQQQQQQQQGHLGTSAPGRGSSAPQNGMTQVQMQLLMQHQQQQQQQQQQQMFGGQKSASQQGGVSALSLGLSQQSGSGSLPRGYGNLGGRK
ncbi:UNVERIFIED_CONTAM: Glucose-repressible alcohol dehydrogenase transcriptional effector [Siphonaria sp. JEL0065]|nr:Glucose-repressible alcohol dehydrogenase transcriptional effector [Siphonaria sp. JEL0065]